MASTAPRSRGGTAITLRVSLKDHVPAIWRHLVVPGEITLSTLHKVLQVAMGWEASHLYVFEIGDQRFAPPDPDGEDDEIDDQSVVLLDVVSERDRFLYEYDFGDSWQHEVVVEEIESGHRQITHPICLEGERACPPEDCGGVDGYLSLLEVLADPEHDEYEQYLERVGSSFDAEAFDPVATNANLRQIE
jgi:hypothetical protein